VHLNAVLVCIFVFECFFYICTYLLSFSVLYCFFLPDVANKHVQSWRWLWLSMPNGDLQCLVLFLPLRKNFSNFLKIVKKYLKVPTGLQSLRKYATEIGSFQSEDMNSRISLQPL